MSPPEQHGPAAALLLRRGLLIGADLNAPHVVDCGANGPSVHCSGEERAADRPER